MYILGVIFAALWFTGIWLARKWEQTSPTRSDRAPGRRNAAPPATRQT